MTGEEDRKESLALGAMRFLVRPIEPEHLLSAVASCLAEKPSHGQNTDR